MADTDGIEPIFISVKNAAKALAVSTWQVYELTSGDEPEIACKFQGSRKLVSVASLRAYADRLPDERPQAAS